MTRIFLIIISIMLLSCSSPDVRTRKKELIADVTTGNEETQGMTYEVVFEKGNDFIIKKKSTFFESVKSNFFSEHLISPNDELDVFLSTKVLQKDPDYEVMIGDTLNIKFEHASKYDVNPIIRKNGSILLPFVGEYNVSGKSTLLIQQDLVELYSAVFRKPQLKVTLPEYLAKIRELRNELRTAKRGLRRLVTVGIDGNTVFPLLGEYKVSGKTLNEVTKELNAEYVKINPMLQADLFLK